MLKSKIKQKTEDFFLEIIKNKIILQAILVGLISGVLVVLFKLLIDGLFEQIQERMSGLSVWRRLWAFPLITTLGGLVSGLLIFKIAPETRGSGIPFVKIVLNRLGSVVRLRSIFVKFFAGIAGIGAGLSLGREGPSVQLGAGAGSLVGRLFRMGGTDQNKLIAAGAGSAIGATFNAPIAGTIFVMEELLQKFSSSLLFPVLAATVTAASVARGFLGNQPSFLIPDLNPEVGTASLVVCVILGFVAGGLGVAFARLVYFNNQLFEKLKNIPAWAKPALAGLVVGLFGLVLPQVLGTGNAGIGQLLSHNLGLGMVFIIFAAEFILTPFCFGSGAAGGIFLPMLMLGSFLGYMLASIAVFLGFNVDISVVSLVGMAAFLSAVARTPITAVVMVFEMTGGYDYILPIMLSAAIADLTAKRFHHKPIYATLMLRQSQNSEEARFLGKKSVKSVMAEDVRSFFNYESIGDVLEVFKTEGHMIYPVIDKKKKLLGIISRSDINDAFIQGKSPETPVGKIMNPTTVVAYPETDLYTVYFRLHLNNAERAVVIDHRKNVRGIVTRQDIYDAAAGTLVPVSPEPQPL